MKKTPILMAAIAAYAFLFSACSSSNEPTPVDPNQQRIQDSLKRLDSIRIADSIAFTGDKAFVFSKDGSYIRVEDANDLHLVGGDMSVEAWVRLTPNGRTQVIMDKRSIPVQGDFWLGLDASGVFRFAAGKSVIDIKADEQVVANQLYHVAATVEASLGVARLYVNGVLAKEQTLDNPQFYMNAINMTEPLYIGSDKAANEGGLKGAVDEVRLWNVTRSEQEINASMHKLLTGQEAGLVAYWDFKARKDSILLDVTGNNHNGTPVGTPEWIPTPFDIK